MLQHLLTCNSSTITNQQSVLTCARLLRQPNRARFFLTPTNNDQELEQSMVQKEQYDQRWHETWEGGLQPGQLFDAGCCSPLLTHLLSSGEVQVEGRKTFVPGCGRGYDVFAFAAAGAAVSAGLDLSPEAIAAAKAAKQIELSDKPAASAAVHLTAGDFFTHSSSAECQGPFDVGYDYTFLCALHPDMRQDWARAWSDLITPGGELVTLIFPVGGTPEGAPKNPPWPVTPQLYQELLRPAGFDQVVLEPVDHSKSHKPRAGREWLGRWRRVGPGSSSSGGGGGTAEGGQLEGALPSSL